MPLALLPKQKEQFNLCCTFNGATVVNWLPLSACTTLGLGLFQFATYAEMSCIWQKQRRLMLDYY